MTYTAKLFQPVQAEQTWSEIFPKVKAYLMAGHRLDLTIKKEKRSEIVKDRNAAILSGFTYLGKTIDSDRDSVMAITAAATAAMAAKSLGLPFNDVWTCADDSTLAVDADTMIGMLIADGRLLTPEQIVDTVLDGLRRAEARPC